MGISKWSFLTRPSGRLCNWHLINFNTSKGTTIFDIIYSRWTLVTWLLVMVSIVPHKGNSWASWRAGSFLITATAVLQWFFFTSRSVSSLLTFSVFLGRRPEEAHRNPTASHPSKLVQVVPQYFALQLELEGGTHAFEEQSSFLQRLGQSSCCQCQPIFF